MISQHAPFFPLSVTPFQLTFEPPIAHHVEAKEAFALFDKRGAGAIPSQSLGDVLRALGQNPTQNQVAELAQSVGGQDSELPSELSSFILMVN